MLWAQTLKPHVCGGRGGSSVGSPIGTKGPLQRNLGGPRRTCAGGIASEHNILEHGFSLFALAVRCPRNNATACYPALEKWLRASESSVSCRSCFHLAELCPRTGARIVVGYRRVVVDVLVLGDFQLFYPPEMLEFAVAALSVPAGQACYSLMSSALPPSRAPQCTERTSTAPTREARSEQRAPAADTTTGMMLSKMQPQKEPRRGNLQERARALRQSV